MKKVLFFSIIALGAMMVSCNKAQNTEEKVEITNAASVEVNALRTAYELAKYGYEVGSATALVEAANIIASVPTQELGVEAEAGTQTENETEKAQQKSLCPTALIAAAKGLADGDSVILAMIAKVEDKIAAVRGAVGGPKYDQDRVNAHDYVYYNINFYGSELAEVAVSGDGDTDLDLYIYDANGNFITSDTDYSDDCYVRWVPSWTGSFKIKIVNRGGVYNRYTLLTN